MERTDLINAFLKKNGLDKMPIEWMPSDIPHPTYPGSFLYMAQNVSKEKRRGMEFSLNHNFNDHLSGYLSYAYMQIKQEKASFPYP